MAKIRPVHQPESPKVEEPEPLKSIVSIQSISEPVEIKAHQLQFIANPDGLNWQCACGHVYPRPPVEVLLSLGLNEWLDKLVKEHEGGNA